MSRDYRYGHQANKKGFQRKSQQNPSKKNSGKSSGLTPTKFGLGMVLMTLNILGVYLIVMHFMSQSSQEAPAQPSEIYAAEVTTPKNVAETPKRLEVVALEQVEPEQVSAQDQVVDESSNSPRYRFYQELKESEVVVDAQPISVKLDGQYFILAGTFGSQQVALKEQQRLAKYGQAVNLSEISHRGKLLYRLSVGPYEDRLALNKRRNELRSLGVDTLVIKSKASKKD